MTCYYIINTGSFFGGSRDFMNQYFWIFWSWKKMILQFNVQRTKDLHLQIHIHQKHVKIRQYRIDGNDQDKMSGRTEIMIHRCACCTPSDWRVQPIDGCSAGIKKKQRVGDTLFVQDYDPLSNSMNLDDIIIDQEIMYE
ncbi:unnamed protein product [Paramecium pentaurelia]|uniref:Uncharacterized protein n=1 Tax=Paramecium pentaurelia TaxID=43138 RepID=A0A8S1VEU1_9CILI|nr:unnamed protein product [Paramecium pentaurelia]